MSTGAVLLILGVSAALALTVQSSCSSLVHCPCGKSGGNITVCFQENGAAENPCRKWAGCKKCQDGLDECLECPEGLEGPFCEKAAPQKAKYRRKRQYYTSTRRQHDAATQSNKTDLGNGPTESADQQECGRPPNRVPRHITASTKTGVGDWPWVVAIAVQEGNSSLYQCGGALLNSNTIVTAAQCLTIAKSFILHFGKFYRLDKNDDEEVMVRRSEKIIIHPDYDIKTMDSGIGLITFTPPIHFTERIQPICLPTPQTTANNLGTGKSGSITGWWLTEKRLPSEELLVVHLPVLTNDACIDSFRRQNFEFPLTSNMYCAGFEEGGQSVCRGSSGSPMVFYDGQTGKYTLEGLVSFGHRGQCGLPGRVPVFTKVSRFVPWILRNM